MAAESYKSGAKSARSKKSKSKGGKSMNKSVKSKKSGKSKSSKKSNKSDGFSKPKAKGNAFMVEVLLKKRKNRILNQLILQ